MSDVPDLQNVADLESELLDQESVVTMSEGRASAVEKCFGGKKFIIFLYLIFLFRR